ncbi:hypothetical protein DEU56DRAFT_767149 [Suillus clintonianus]|uniref:uncharacterized protein n=1 Tax=Suillus clintonianus TaxID=1904413 RepID=UPI001B87A852|nr:uncharacterized protein DEU56DRAFT_767149 [Suillus clintonianus]KAG2155385.1 hypothetical protein DEU56DRAFT_767149 [Suillus clintonianus]
MHVSGLTPYTVSFTTMIMSAAVMAGIVTAITRVLADMYECGRLAGFNKGYSFLFYCSEDNTVELIKTCNCVTCCTVVNGGVGVDGSFSCT